MVKFKIYDKKQKKFVQQSASDKVWKVRYNLGIWNNSVNDKNLAEMYKIMKRNDKHLELYVKIDGRFKPVSKEVIDSVLKQHKEKEPERKERRRLQQTTKWKENYNKMANERAEKIFCQRTMKEFKNQKKKGKVKQLTKWNYEKRCKKVLEKNKTKKR